MSEFKPIETQEQFDAMIADRLTRKENSVRSEYADYDDLKKQIAGFETAKADYEKQIAEANEKIAAHDQTVASLNEKISAYEADSLKRKVADEEGLPKNAVKFLTGANEEEMRAAAKDLMAVFGSSVNQAPVVTQPAAPLRNQEAESEGDGVMAAFKKLNPNIKV